MAEPLEEGEAKTAAEEEDERRTESASAVAEAAAAAVSGEAAGVTEKKVGSEVGAGSEAVVSVAVSLSVVTKLALAGETRVLSGDGDGGRKRMP